MKLLTKLSLFITLSKIIIVILFIGLLPTLVSKVSFQYTNYSLTEQKKKVLAAIARNGIDAYLQGDSAYGSYTMLKEEYISLSPAGGEHIPDTIETSRRIVDNDTLDYRVLTHSLEYGHKRYLLEIGKTNRRRGRDQSACGCDNENGRPLLSRRGESVRISEFAAKIKTAHKTENFAQSCALLAKCHREIEICLVSK